MLSIQIEKKKITNNLFLATIPKSFLAFFICGADFSPLLFDLDINKIEEAIWKSIRLAKEEHVKAITAQDYSSHKAEMEVALGF